MEERQMTLGQRLANIERALHEMNHRLAFLDNVQIPFIYSKLSSLERTDHPPAVRPSQETAMEPPAAAVRVEPEKERAKEPEEMVEELKVESSEEETEEAPEEFVLDEAPKPMRAGKFEGRDKKNIPDEEAPSVEQSKEAHEYERIRVTSLIPEISYGAPPGPYESQGRERRNVKKDALKMEMAIGGKWFQRLGLFFIGLAFVILGFYITELGPEVKAALIFSGGGVLLVAGEYIYTHHKRIFQKYLSAYGVWLVMGGTEILYIGAWWTHSEYKLIGFENFMVLILGIMVMNIAFSLRHKHPLMVIQYLTTFYLVCLAVHLHYPGPDPQFPTLFLVGTSLILAVDMQVKKNPDNTTLTLGYSSLLLFFLLGRTEGTMPYLLSGYLVILLVVSHLHREVDAVLGFGKVPDLYWGSMLVLSYLHSLNYLLQGGEESIFPGIFGLVTIGMILTYYSPTLFQKIEHYRFATDLEFYFITGVFFFLFFTLSPDPFLFPILLISGISIGFFNLKAQRIEGPRLLSTGEYVVLGPRKGALYLLDNRTRFHLFLLLLTMITIPGIVAMHTTPFMNVVYISGFISTAFVLGLIEYRRSDEDALQTLRNPIYREDGSIEIMVFEPNPVFIDHTLSQGLKGVILNFLILLIALSLRDSILPLIPFFAYLATVFLLNQEYSSALLRQMHGHTKDEPGGLERLRSRLKEKWEYTEGFDQRVIILFLAGIFAVMAGLIVEGMALYSMSLFLLLVVLVQLDTRYTGRNAFLLRKEGSDDFPGLFRDSEGYLLYIPFIPLVIFGRLHLPWFGHYGPYLFLISILIIERYLYHRCQQAMPLHVLSIVVLGLATSFVPFAGFVFLASAGILAYLDQKELTRNPILFYILPIIFLYVARLIVAINGNDLFRNGLPSPLPLTIEAITIIIFLYLSWGIYLRNLEWKGPTESGRKEAYPELMALLLLLPVTIPQYHLGVLLIPAGILYLSLRMNAPFENLVSMSIFIWASWDFMNQFMGGKTPIYSMLVLVCLFLVISIILEGIRFGNDASMSMLGLSTLGALIASGYAFEGGVPTTAFWTILSVALIIAGFILEKRYLRWTGIFVLILTAGKILMYDLVEMPDWARAISLIVTGVSLLGVSYLYFWYRERIERKEMSAALETE